MVLEEAFRYGSIVHAMNRLKNGLLLDGRRLGGQKSGRELHASLLIQAAESAANIGQTKQAATLLAGQELGWTADHVRLQIAPG
jgi:hypothetical protein